MSTLTAFSFRAGLFATTATMFAALVAVPVSVNGATPHPAGELLSLALEDDVAQELGLSDEVRQSLAKFVDQRAAQAGRLEAEIKELAAPEQQTRRANFAAISERAGLAPLTVEQQKRLQELRIARVGLSILTDRAMAEQFLLSNEQREQFSSIAAERNKKLQNLGDDARDALRAQYEQKLRAVLKRPQTIMWDAMTGQDQLAQAEEQPDAEQDTKPAAAAGEAQAAEASEEKPAATTEAAPPADTAADEKPAAASAAAAQPAADEKPAAEATATTDQPAEPAQEAEPAKADVADAAAVGEAPKEVTIRFNFSFTPWDEVIKDFAAKANLAIVTDPMPTLGTLNYYGNNREFSIRDALDELNGILLTKGYTMLRRDRLLMIINLEDGVPPGLVIEVPLDKLDEVGKYELSKTRFRLRRMTSDEAKEAADKMVGQQGSVVAVGPNQIVVTETGGNLRLIRDMIDGVENPTDGSDAVSVFKLDVATTEDVLLIARPLLGLDDGINVNDDIQISPDPIGNRLYATGLPAMVDRLGEIVKAVDQGNVDEDPTDTVIELPQLEVHEINSDPTTALDVLSTLLAGESGVRLAIDPETQNLVAMATPSQHRKIVAVLKQLEAESVTTDTIQLYNKDPAEAVLLINKLLGLDDEAIAAKGPKIDGDIATGRLIVRGKPEQIRQIREMLAQVDPDPGTLGAAERTNVRILPLSPRQADAVLEQLDFLWPTTGRMNRIRVVPLHGDEGSRGGPEIITNPESSRPRPPQTESPDADRPAPPQRPLNNRAAGIQRRGVQVRFASERSPVLQDRPRRPSAIELQREAAVIAAQLAQAGGQQRPRTRLAVG